MKGSSIVEVVIIGRGAHGVMLRYYPQTTVQAKEHYEKLDIVMSIILKRIAKMRQRTDICVRTNQKLHGIM